MRYFLNFYLKSRFTFHLLNIIFAVLVPVVVTFVFFNISVRAIVIEGIIGICMAFVMTYVMGGYEKLKKGYEEYKKNS